MGLGKTCQVFTTIIVSKLIFELQRDELMSLDMQGNDPSSMTCLIKGHRNRLYPTPLLLIVLDNIEIRGMGLYIYS